MIASSLYKKKFNIEYIRKYYIEKMKFKSSPGLDRINERLFENKFNKHIEIICTKVNNDTYKFTPYKEKLIPKGRDKKPRLISIPTIRDKLTLGILKEIIYETYQSEIKHELVQTVISDIKENLSSYNYYIKIDLKNYYGTIKHDILLKIIKRKIRKKEIINLIEKAIRTPTVDDNAPKNNRYPELTGLPQGLPISNVLASLYLNNLDKKHSSISQYNYYRYVDDILILCDEKNYKEIMTNIKNEIIDEYKLEINDDKDENGEIKNSFLYLGYVISPNTVKVRNKSIHKFENAIENLFREYVNSKKDKTEMFVWSLNLKITGSKKNNNKYGWLFFFSQIEDETILFKLDWLVQHLIDRFGIRKDLKDLKIKRFVRAYKEIRLNLDKTKYIPDLDAYTIDDKKAFLKDIYKMDIRKISDYEVEHEFEKVIYRSLKELEKDIQHFS